MKSKKKTEKLAYRLDEVSRMTSVESKVIEKWEKEFYFLHAGQTASGHKIFRQKDVDIIQRLKELLENEHLTLAGAKRRIEEDFRIKGSVSLHPDRLKKVLSSVREQLRDIASTLEKKL